MNITTSRFGEIEIDESLLIDFKMPIIGYNNLKKYILIEHDENSCFKWLQSVENSEIAFPVTLTTYFNIDYVFEISDDNAEKIGLNSSEDLLVLNLASIPQANPKEATINLRAPVVVNTANLYAMQIILSDDSLPIKYPLFKKDAAVAQAKGE